MAENDDEKLIEQVRQYPALWDLTDLEYKNLSKKPLIWSEIAENMGTDCMFLVFLWL